MTTPLPAAVGKPSRPFLTLPLWSGQPHPADKCARVHTHASEGVGPCPQGLREAPGQGSAQGQQRGGAALQGESLHASLRRPPGTPEPGERPAEEPAVRKTRWADTATEPRTERLLALPVPRACAATDSHPQGWSCFPLAHSGDPEDHQAPAPHGHAPWGRPGSQTGGLAHRRAVEIRADEDAPHPSLSPGQPGLTGQGSRNKWQQRPERSRPGWAGGGGRAKLGAG